MAVAAAQHGAGLFKAHQRNGGRSDETGDDGDDDLQRLPCFGVGFGLVYDTARSSDSSDAQHRVDASV